MVDLPLESRAIRQMICAARGVHLTSAAGRPFRAGRNPFGFVVALSTGDDPVVDWQSVHEQSETAAGPAMAARGPDVSPRVTLDGRGDARPDCDSVRTVEGIPSFTAGARQMLA